MLLVGNNDRLLDNERGFIAFDRLVGQVGITSVVSTVPHPSRRFQLIPASLWKASSDFTDAKISQTVGLDKNNTHVGGGKKAPTLTLCRKQVLILPALFFFCFCFVLLVNVSFGSQGKANLKSSGLVQFIILLYYLPLLCDCLVTTVTLLWCFILMSFLFPRFNGILLVLMYRHILYLYFDFIFMDFDLSMIR